MTTMQYSIGLAVAMINLQLMLAPGQIPPSDSSASTGIIDYCMPDKTLPNGPFPECGLCQGRCGEIKNFYIEIYCSCDANCAAYGDCCRDFRDSCPAEYDAGQEIRQHFKYKQTDCYGVRTLDPSSLPVDGELGVIVPDFLDYNFVAICGQTGVTCNRTSPYSINEPNLAIPITDKTTGINYVNYDCAKCNNVTDPIPWIIKFICQPRSVPFHQDNITTIKTEEGLELYKKSCGLNYVIPQEVTARPFCVEFTVRERCPLTCNNTALVDKCNNAETLEYIRSRNGVYDNFYCALCFGEDPTDHGCVTFPYHDVAASGDGNVFSLSLLFDFNPSEGVTVGRKACSTGQQWIPTIQECRQVSCPDDRRLVGGTCLPRHLEFDLFASFYSNRSQDVDELGSQLKEDTQIIQALSIRLHPLIPDTTLVLKLNHSFMSDNVLNVTLTMIITFHRNSTFNFASDLAELSTNTSSFFRDQLILFIQDSDVNLGNVVLTINENTAFKQALLLDCTWFTFSEHEFELINNTLLIKTTEKKYEINRYRLVGKSALVCVLDSVTSDIHLDVSPVLGILTIVLISLSIVCLLIRLFLQFRIPYFKSFAGKLQFQLFLVLCLAFIMLLLGGIVSLYGPRELCAAFGILMYWFFLAAFCWMAAVTFDTWLVFRPSATFIKASDTNKSLMKYTLPCWLISAGITIIVTSLDFVAIDPRFKPQFGMKICWFNQRYALLAYFGGPVALLTLFTTILFIMIMVYLKRTLQNTVRTTSEGTSHDFWIYFRLFSLMGVSWIFGFVAAFVGHDALWIIFIILNASQGIFVFVSFIINRQVWKEIRNVHSKYTQTGSTGSTGTSSENSEQKRDKKRIVKGKPTTSV